MKRIPTYVVLGMVLLINGSLLFINDWADAAKSEWISFTSNRSGNFDIYVVDTNGENLRNLTNHPARELEHAWSPDGRFLAYVSNRDGDFKIYVMDTRTGEHRRLTNHHEKEWAPAWSPDGKWIAFVSRSDKIIPPVKFKITSHIYRIDANGANLVQLTDQGKNLRPAWSPDSKQIAFVSYHRGKERKGLYIMNADGRQLRRVNDQQVQALNGIFQNQCVWSPNGKRIAFSIIAPRDDRMHLCVIDADGKNFRQLTRGGPILKPAVGKPAVGKQLKPVIAGKQPPTFPLPEIGSPAWAPDGKWIAYAFSETVFWGTADIYIIDAEGNRRGTPLVKNAGRNLSPAWVPEEFLSVAPSVEKQTTLWGRLKQMKGTSK
ncbi:MAG: amine dehydrogenase large subunit [Candidatus Poribacteria bacterium]|nr:amine dehydrogenase large subunit [Candidatus Poribacteria bacterium]